MKTPSVIHIVPAPDGGGAERLVRELTERLPFYGVQAEAIYYHNPRCVELTDQEANLGVDSVRALSVVKKVRNALLERGVGNGNQIVHAHLTWPLYHLALLHREIGGPMVFTEHNTHNRRRESSWLRPLERLVYGKYEKLVAISDGTRDSLVGWLSNEDLSQRITTIENGSRMLPWVQRKLQPAQSVRLVSVGSLTLQKGFDVALQAIEKLGDQVECYTILGEGPERARLEYLAKELGLQGKVRFAGYCNDVGSHLHKADLAVIPSRWEGFGLVAVEALSTGLPVVASDVAGLRGVLVGCEAALLVPPGNATELYNRLQYAIDNLVGREEIGIAARARAEKFTIEVMVAKYADLYKQLAVERQLGRCS